MNNLENGLIKYSHKFEYDGFLHTRHEEVLILNDMVKRHSIIWVNDSTNESVHEYNGVVNNTIKKIGWKCKVGYTIIRDCYQDYELPAIEYSFRVKFDWVNILG
jgi:hypothetical protein